MTSMLCTIRLWLLRLLVAKDGPIYDGTFLVRLGAILQMSGIHLWRAAA